eukprot:TRINITY_DN1297_c0_g1_i4.p1 TRINITY_DN1297_c0_g1~~TRINITY_DN1297_c0_g1_i4.p1  ORF type:complete len:169 (-),score=28.87 TRINITY_DN1297_c0_g1_i4:102-608(-)
MFMRPGSGCIISFIAKLLGNERLYLANDLNIDACLATQVTANVNNVAIEVVHTSFFEGMERLHGKVDLLVFNPPYVPSEEEELNREDLYAAWAGGVDGREVIDQLLPVVNPLLSIGGCFYMMVILENKPKEIQTIMEGFGFRSEGVILKRRAFNELLHVLKFVKVREA